MTTSSVFRGVAPAVLLATTAAWCLASFLRFQAGQRLEASSHVVEQLHVALATLCVPLSFAMVAAGWLMLGRTLVQRLLSRCGRSAGQTLLGYVLLSWLLLGAPGCVLASALMQGTSAFRAGTTEWQIGCLALILAPAAWALLALLERGLEAVRRRHARATACALALLTVAALATWSLVTAPFAERYGASQLLCFGLVVAGIVLVWTAFFAISSRTSSSRDERFVVPLACAFVSSVVALLVPPSPAGLELFYLERPTKWFARALGPALPDRDGDGAPGNVGFLRGGDCDDSDPRRHPFARDIPGNGLDENCFGGDATKAFPSAPPFLRAVTDDMAPSDRANVIVVAIDSLRFDHRFENGLDPAITPTLARLAGQGVAFSNFRTCSPRTRESIPDLLGAGASFSRTSGENAIEALARRGVHTTFVASDWLARYVSVAGFTARRMPRARYGQFADDEVVDQALAFLADRPAEPFFLFTHWLGAHEPYDGDAACLASAASDRARYACALAALDRKLGSLYVVLRTRGLAERTVLAVSADHGEEFGEHGGRFHATTLYDEVLHVPMFVLTHGRAPALVTNPFDCRDFLPTVLGVANYPEGISPYGRNVLGPDPPVWSPQVARTRQADEASRFEPRVHAVVHRGHKLLFDGASGVLVYFDLEHDPSERVPLLSAPPAVERELIVLMDAWLSDQAEVRPSTSRSVLAARRHTDGETSGGGG